MPPKKQEQQLPPYRPCYVLPIFVNGPESPAAVALTRAVNVKKNIDEAKIIEVLKDKGLEQYITNGKINQQGRIFACQNLKVVCDQFIASLSKPVDTKKDAKKDAKKDTKKQETVVQNVAPPIQIQFQKSCNDFFVFLDMPGNAQELEAMLSKEGRIDIVVVIKEKTKPGSRKPNYDLLNSKKSYEDIAQALKETNAPTNPSKVQTINYEKNSKQMVDKLRAYRSKLTHESPNQNFAILQIPYLDNLSKQEQNPLTFIRSFFQRICKCTLELQQYKQWKATRKLVPMIEPIKEVITKQVQVQQKPDKNKKGGKAQPTFETVTQTIQKRYEDVPQHIKSDLKNYFSVKKVKQSQPKETNRDNYSVFKQIISDCLSCFEAPGSQVANKNYIEGLSKEIKREYDLQPINKIGYQNLSNGLRNINYVKNISMDSPVHFQFPKIDSDFSFMQLSQKSGHPIQELRAQFIINKVENMVRKASPKLKWNFGDRFFVQKLTKVQLAATINKSLLFDPQIFTGRLQTQGLNILVMSRTNPPGRVLYHNSIMDWKVVPDFQNWFENFYGSDQLLKKEQFFDYSFENTGNLAVKVKNMMPADNTIIKHEMYTVGSKRCSLVRLSKNKHRFGLTSKQLTDHKIYLYWHKIQQQYRVRAFKNSSQVAVELQNKGKYTVLFDPNPTIFWQQGTKEKIRKIDSLGQITSYRTDGSIHIYHPNSDISIYKNGKWSRVISEQQNQKTSTLNEGQNQIKIREDFTIMIIDGKQNKKIIFPDGTQIFQNVKERVREIKNPNGPFVRIYLPRDYNLNVIGHGSAFAYLGFKNILQRSYDGYLFQFIDNQISSHYYFERFDKEGIVKTEHVRLISYKDGSVLKINSKQAKIVFNSPVENQVLTEETQNKRWLQTFTTPTNHGEGVFDINLNAGQIETKDSQTNRFVAKVDQRSQSQIAVSFITEDEDDSVANFPNGFHVKQQNYFLPLPANSIPPKIFIISHDGSGSEYLNSQQIGDMKRFSMSKEAHGHTYFIQYCSEDKNDTSFLTNSFSKPVDLQIFGLPDALKPVETKQNLIPVRFNDISHRTIEEIRWNSQYTNIQLLENKLREEKKIKAQQKQIRKGPSKPLPIE